MPISKSAQTRQKITAAFIEELQKFKRGGYKFEGSDRELFEGTQREAFDAYLQGIKAGHNEGYFEIPTGVGKTALFIAIIGCYLRATENMPDAPRVLIHEPTVDLVGQTALSFADFMPEIAKTIEADDDQGREIDWAQSEIDIHHGGRKGAKNKPRVLITTYQSQAADERREDPSKKVYKPEDYQLVIHDEAHYLTGAKYGPAAVDKFQGAIQLGVTATPEYSDNKIVANKLEHRYYNLPLKTAIERGDLCHVRQILIKTTSKTKIDLEKAKKFLFDRSGKIFTDDQLQQLLNQEARNQAIAKAYLTGSHPDTGERFLGQTGMIFAGGIQHCDDFIRDTYKALDKPAYREVKNWLRDEGLALIAPIHSKIPKEGVEITIGGKKKICTKEEIKELHRQGKILLIISDQELKLGSDFPRDSFIADAIDRFSVPDATQRMGRGFRVDRPNPRYNYPGNPDKSCAAINVIDETTHDMYKGTEFYPIHANEILHGAQHRPPNRRTNMISRFKSQPPEVTESLEELGFEFITRMEAIKGIAKKFEENKKQKLPEKTDDWWAGGVDMKARPNGGSKITSEAVTALTKAYNAEKGKKQKDGSMLIAHGGNEFHVQKMQSGTRTAVCFLGKDFIKAGLVHTQTLPLKTETWWSAKDIEDKNGGRSYETVEAITKLQEAFNAGKGKKQEDGSIVIAHGGHKFHAQKMQAGTRPAICFSANDIIKSGLVREHPLPTKNDDWWSVRDIRGKPIGQSVKTSEIITKLTKAFEVGEGIEQKDGSTLITHSDHKFHVQKMQGGVRQPICFLAEDIIKAGLVNEKPGRESLKTRPPAKKDISSHGEHIHSRTGRSRGLSTSDID